MDNVPDQVARGAGAQVRLFRLPVKSINLLGAGVAKQERRVIGSPTQPNAPVPCLAEILQVSDSFDLVIANADSHHGGMIFFMQEINIV